MVLIMDVMNQCELSFLVSEDPLRSPRNILTHALIDVGNSFVVDDCIWFIGEILIGSNA